MLDTIYPWCVGVVVFTVAFYLIAALIAPLLDGGLPPCLAWVGWMTDRTITMVNVTMGVSLVIIAAMGITYGCYRLGLVVIRLFPSAAA